MTAVGLVLGRDRRRSPRPAYPHPPTVLQLARYAEAGRLASAHGAASTPLTWGVVLPAPGSRYGR